METHQHDFPRSATRQMSVDSLMFRLGELKASSPPVYNLLYAQFRSG